MSTSGVSVLSRSASDIITSALRRARIIPVRQQVSSIDLTTGIEVLNNMVAALRAEGWNLWKQEEYVLFLDQGKTDYKIGPSGDRAVFLGDFLQTALSVATVAADTTLTVDSTTGFTGSDNQLSTNPATSASGWVSVDAGVVSAASILTITNTDTDGFSEFSVDSTSGVEYFFEVDVTETTGEVTLEVYGGVSVTLITSQAVTVDGTQIISFTATEVTTRLRFVNDNIAGVTAVSNFLFKETDTGETAGFRVSAALREWNIVTRVISSTVLALKNVVVNVGAINESVLAFKSLPPRPLKLVNYRSKNVSFVDEVPMNTWARQEYMKQTNKTSQGRPTQAYYNPTLVDGRLYVWQTASDVNQIVLFTGDKPLEIFSNTANNPDFPAEWFEMLSWGLAALIGPEYGIPLQRQQLLEIKAERAKELAFSWDEEAGSLLIGPDMNY